jgi:TRAP-type C4-dicarboxylate transport system permease small subunit
MLYPFRVLALRPMSCRGVGLMSRVARSLAFTLLPGSRGCCEDFHSELGPPLWIPYSLMTVGMALLAVQLVMQIVQALTPSRAPE